MIASAGVSIFGILEDLQDRPYRWLLLFNSIILLFFICLDLNIDFRASIIKKFDVCCDCVESLLSLQRGLD